MTTDELAQRAADEIRAAQMARLAAMIEIAPPLGPKEFTIRDAGDYWPDVSENTLERHLKSLVKSGVLGSDYRIDGRTGRRALAYWFKEAAE